MQEINPVSGTREAVIAAVREAMAERKVSGRALAAQLRMPQSVLSRRMTGEIPFTVDELAAIATALNWELTLLVTPAEAAGAA
jgi:transcriptional regulator with XRE-family HTH domain